jgi:methylated-DNA-[protein]-cysteine S-methyltransferase
MAEPGFTLFDTALGRCGIAWTELGIASVEFPQRDDGATRQRLQRDAPGARELPPPLEVQRAIDGIVALLAGEPTDLSPIALDLTDVPPFHREVYAVARTIPPGATLTYGEIAARLGDPTASRAVGQALGRNPFPIVVPCHRVVAAGGRLGGFSARGGTDTKLRLLDIERRNADAGLTLFD